MKHQIELDEEQYNEIITALEFYNRFHTGQVGMVLEDCDYTDSAEKSINYILNISAWDYRTKPLTYEISRMMLYAQNKYKWINNVHSAKPLNPTGKEFITVNYDIWAK